MPTLMKPEDVAKLDLASYKKALEKDFARNGRNQKWEDFVFITDFKMGAKKTALFLLASATDKVWADAVKTAKTNGKKYTTGICKIAIVADQDGNGKEDIQITIKEAKGDLSKKKIAESIKTELFADDVDVQTLVLADDEEEVRHVHFEEAPHSPELATETLDHAQQELAAREKLDSFMQAFQDFMSKIGSARLLQEATQEKLRILVEHKDTPNILTEANKAAHEIKLQIADFDEIIATGETWFAENKDKVKALLGVQGYKEKMESAKERIMNLKRLQRFLTQSEDYINEKYLHDFEGDLGQDLQNKQINADQKFAALREYALDYRTKYQQKADMQVIMLAINSTESRLTDYNKIADSLKSPQQQKFAADVAKHLSATRTTVELSIISDIPELKAFGVAYKQYLELPQPTTLDECRDRLARLDILGKQIADLVDANPAQVSILLNSFNTEPARIRNIIEKRFKDAHVERLIANAGGRDNATPETLFDAFMAEFRNKAKYTPEQGGNLFFGTPRGNCQDFCNSLGLLFKACDIDCDTSDVLQQFYLTTPVDNLWLDPTAPGNTNVVGRPDELRYFFSDHWVVKVKAGGQRYCPTTGRKLGSVEETIGVVIGAKDKDKFENAVCEFEKAANPAENRGFTYKVAFK